MKEAKLARLRISHSIKALESTDAYIAHCSWKCNCLQYGILWCTGFMSCNSYWGIFPVSECAGAH